MRRWEELRLQSSLLGGEGGAGDGELRPGVEDLGSLWDWSIFFLCVGVRGKRVREEQAYFGTRAALQLGLDLPRKRRPSVFMQNYIVAFGVDIFSVDEKSVHIKETGADFRESGAQC